MLKIRPATSLNIHNNQSNTDLTSLTDFRTPSLPNDINFNHQVDNEPLHKLKRICNENVKNLHLVQPDHTSISRTKCSVSVNYSPQSSNIPTSSTSQLPNTTSHGKRCQVCKNTIKGRRGLMIHLGRSPNCKRNYKMPPSISLLNHHDSSLPSEITKAVKCPSTSVESVDTMCGDGTNTKIKTHNSNNRCNLCHRLSTKDHFVSSSTHRVYEASIPDNITSVNCNCANIIYLITCRKCRLQYVGETAQLLRERIRHHVGCMNHPEKEHQSRILIEHFSQGLCKNATFTVNIIEKLTGDGRGADGKLDPALTRIRRKKETDRMLRLRTVYPYGLNDRVGDEYMNDRNSCNIFSKFPSLKRMKGRQKIRTKTSTSDDFIVENFIYIINESLRTNLRNTMNLIRVLLSSLKISHCRILFDRISDFLSEKHDTFLHTQFFKAGLDILTSKIGKPPKISVVHKCPPSNRIHISFNNKAIDFINIQKILRDKDIRNSLPHHLRTSSHTVIYQLSDTIRSKLFNYKKFVQSFDVDAFIADNSVLPCECDHSPFVNADHGHVISGDLNIVSDAKLRNLIAKGPKYREPLPFSCSKAKHDILTGIDNFIDTWSNKEGMPITAFSDWKNMIISKINDRISSLVIRKKKSLPSIFKDNAAKTCLSELQSRYIMVPIDKAGNNIAFICKRFYAQVLLKELGLMGSSTSTYTKISQLTPDNIVTQHHTELKQKFNISVDNSMLTLPDIYWIPKLHKNPVKFRFIIASKRCTTKILSKHVSSIFSLFQKQIDTYHKKSHYYSGIKSYWIVQNRDPILHAINKSCTHRSAKCLSSFDFSTLYTKIPHNKLIDVLNKIIDFAFKGGTRNKISISKSGSANWVNKSVPSTNVYTKASITEAVSYLIKNCYFKLGNKLFRQDIGIPMGSDPAPAFANLFLFHYESSWLNSVKKTSNILARKFGQVYRYIDDLLALNDGHSFEAFHHEIYPEELQLNKENDDNKSTNFLDLHIEIDNGNFTTQLFDKRDHFGFDITRLPYKESNIPCKMFYNSIAAECLRICRATSASGHATSSIKILLARMVKQGADMFKMRNCVTKTFNRHQINLKYGIHDNSFIDQLFR